MAMILNSPAFGAGERIPKRQSCEGDDLSPPLAWSGAPEGTRSFALVCEDPDAPAGVWHHWGVYNIPADRHELAEGFPALSEVDGIRQAVTDFGRPGYGGPCPPRGHGTHHYYFRLYALNAARLDLPFDADCEQVKQAAKAHAIEEAGLMGTYAR